MTTRLRLICHGSTPALRTAGFPDDEPLDQQGLRKLSAVSARLPRRCRVWTSPALRAVQTAAALSPDARIEPLLRDWDFGRWRGRGLDEVQASEPDAVAAWLGDPSAAPHGGETLLALLGRVASWLEVQRAAAGPVAAVTHAAVIRAALVAALDATPRSFWRFDIAPLSVTMLRCSRGPWSLASIGPLRTTA